MVATDVASDIRQQVYISPGGYAQTQIARLDVQASANRWDEGRYRQLLYRQAQQSVMHDSVAYHYRIDDSLWLSTNLRTQVLGQIAQRINGQLLEVSAFLRRL